MSNKQFLADIISPQDIIYSGEAVSLVAPGELGSFGILPGHAPLVSKLIPGPIIVKESSGKILRFQSRANGILEVQKDQVKVLVDHAENEPI